MIVVKLMGGLGNQLFQFAVSFALSRENSQRLALDKSGFSSDLKRDFELSGLSFNNYTFFTKEDRRKINWKKSKLSLFKIPYYQERDVSFNEEVLRYKKSVYLEGYFQSHRYFEKYEKELKFIFSDLKSPSKLYEGYVEKLSAPNCAAIHIRRGDYVTDSHTNSVHGVAGMNYYKEATGFLETNVNNSLKYYIFTDDPGWVEQNFQSTLEGSEIVDPSCEMTSLENLLIMSKCQHIITANSTFSWWGAWLSGEDGVVITPKKWFKDQRFETEDRIPSWWVRL